MIIDLTNILSFLKNDGIIRKSSQKAGEVMTALQEQAINLIKKAPEEKVTFIIHYLGTHSDDKKSDLERSKTAYRRLMSLCRKGSSSEDYKEDLAKALEEKYESIS